MDPVVEALVAQQTELAEILSVLGEAEWHNPTRCEGWDVADVVLHLAQTDEMAISSATGQFPDVAETLAGELGSASSVDEKAALMVERERGRPTSDLLGRWASGAARLVGVLDGMDLSTRVSWVAGELSARTLATTRIAETWIHAGDVADAVGVKLLPTDRLRLIARLAWRTLPYAFASAGLTMHGPAAFRLTSPQGEPWDYLPDSPRSTTISGPPTELCAVAARRVDPSSTSLTGEGPDVDQILALVRTYA
jgi:uncharacterized protein (TIGR03084 family)